MAHRTGAWHANESATHHLTTASGAADHEFEYARRATDAWLELIPYMEPDDLRMLLDEAGAFRSAELLQATGIPLAGAERDPRALELAAAVLTEMRGHPNDRMEAEPIA